MKTPHIDRIAHEGVTFTAAFHPTPICSPNRASILTGQYASRHGVIDNVARDALSHRLANYHLELQKLGYETAHVGKWHMGNSADPRPGYDHWVSFPGHGRIENPEFNEDGRKVEHQGYITDLLNERALRFIERRRDRPYALFLAHKAVHPDAFQHPDGTLDVSRSGGYVLPARHADLYKGEVFPPRPNVRPPDEVARSKPAWATAFKLRESGPARAILAAFGIGTQEEIRRRAAMMASVDEGVGQIFASLERAGTLDETFLLFLGDNGYFFGEHGLGPERRFGYEEGIKSPFIVRYPPRIRAGSRIDALAMTIDIAPTCIALAGGRPGPDAQGRSLLPLFAGRTAGWRRSVLCEYFAENAMPWLVGMGYRAVRTRRHKLIHWTNKNAADGRTEELYDLIDDPFELTNLAGSRKHAATRERLRRELRKLVADSVGL
jgi:arylsulfatase A-like enzyme